MKKRVLLSLATATLFSIGVADFVNTQNIVTPVEAAKNNYPIKLKHNAYIYNKNGKRKGKKVLKKQQTLLSYGQTKINGKKYYLLSQGQYIKAANVVQTKDKNSSSKAKIVYLINKAPIYNSQGHPTGQVLKKGLTELTHGVVKIKGKQFYILGNNHYILVSSAIALDGSDKQVPSENNNNASEKDRNKDNKSNTGNNSDEQNPESSEKPTQSEINFLLKNGYVYFTDDEVNQIRNLLWTKIQNYRVENGYQPYKANAELDNFVNNSTIGNNMFLCQSAVNSQDVDQIAPYLPSLKENGMQTTRGINKPIFYSITSPGFGFVFDLKDRNIEHVATAMFDALKSSPEIAKRIRGDKDNKAYGALAMKYFWNGTSSSVGMIFIEVCGDNPKWNALYNSN
ncbi:surface layer protein [Lactobacillus bombicola]|uniref:Surface layer protein n=1 Tax=Lactobacillus bombicola TaxID=1505723 RepID=A0A1I1TTV4_9LACO|nr:SLAP domain-containing protein [Lactobacillus bombicola]SFD62106.1 surface layer protein [Lactobacillus bombicola]